MSRLIALCLLILLLPVPSALAAIRVQEIKTPAGFTVWLMEEHSLPIVSAQVSFTGSGMAYDPPDREGRTNMAAALLLEGAGSRDAKSFNEALEDNAIRLSIGADDDVLQAHLQTLAMHKEQAFALLSDALIRPRFDADAIARVRAKMQAILTEQGASPYFKLSRAWQAAAYGSHPYSRSGLGTDESLKRLAEKDVRSYVQRYLAKDNIVISVVGDVTAAQIGALIDGAFGELPPHRTPDSEVADIAIPAEAASTSVTHDMPQTLVSFGLPGIRRDDSDYIPAFVMNHLLGGSGLGSRLADEIRIKRGLAYSVRTQLEPKAHAAAWRGMFSTRAGEAANAIAVLKDTLADFRRNGPAPEALEDAKSYLTGSLVLDLSSNEEVAGFLTMMQIHKLGSDYLDRRNALIAAVTPADIRRVSERLIDPARLRMVTVGSAP